jgi:Tetrapyrrole (Corrin/Porphyrin) Methylases
VTSLREFLTQLSVDPMKLAEYIRDAAGTMERAGVDEQSRRVLRSGSPGAMWEAVLGQPGPAVANLPPTPPSVDNTGRGSLIVVGTGIRTVGHLTLEAIAWIKESDIVLYLVAEPVAEDVIRSLNPRGAMSLRGYYGEGLHRSQSYEAMVQHILSCVRAGLRTCVAFYGHPGVFAYPSHESIRRARQEGYPARMLPGISAEDCLFADLGVDPAVNGCQSYEATDFLLHVRNVDTSSQLVLWQVGVVGDWTYRTGGYNLSAFPLLVSRLCQFYAPTHEGYVYEAATLPGLPPTITRIPLGSLTPAYVNAGSTLYVPPYRPTTANRAMLQAIGWQQ